MASRLFLVCAACAVIWLGGCDSHDVPPPATPIPPAAPPVPGGPQAVENPRTAPVKSVADQLEDGFRRLAARDLSAAEQIATEVLLQEPDNGRAMVLAAQVAVGRNEPDSAVRLLREAAAVLPEQSMQLSAQVAMILWQSDRLNESRAEFIRLLRDHPEYDSARRGLAELLNQQGYRFDANQQIRFLTARRSVQLTVDELRCLIFPARAFQDFAEKPRVEDREWIAAEGEMNVARALFGEGDVRDALTVLDNGELLRAGDPAASAFFGQVLLDSQQYDRFESWLVDVDEKAGRYPAYWMALGGWALHKRRPELAVGLIAEAIRREPGDVVAYDRMRQALTAAGDAPAAKRFEQQAIVVRDIQKGLRLIYTNPNIDPAVMIELARLLDQVGRPLEAKCWRSFSAHRMGQGPAGLRQADSELTELLGESSRSDALQKQLCGLDLSRYPADAEALIAATVAAVSSTAGESTADPEADTGPPPAASPVFVDIASALGLRFTYRNADPPRERYFKVHEGLGAGIACIDFDLDGAVDLYFAQGACNAPHGVGKLPNLLARNLGSAFRSVTDAAGCDDRGYSLGVTSGDWNQDGFPDLVVGNMKRNRLFLNQGDGTFRLHRVDQTDGRTGDPLWDRGGYTASLAIADVTGDHLPDIIEVNYLDDEKIFEPLQLGTDGIPVRFPGPLHFRAATDRVYVGRGDGGFIGRELTTETPSPGLGLLVTDIDGNGDNEIFVANDLQPNQLWVRRSSSDPQAPEYVDAAVARGLAHGPAGASLACMGIAAADFDENGYLDLHITNFADQWANQYMQNQEHLFDDLTLPYGLDGSTLAMLGFGTEALDFDNNGTIDLVTGNGHIEDFTHEGKVFEMPPQLFAGDRRTLTETRVAGDATFWESDRLTRGLVTLDWNRDGRTDFVVGDLKRPVALLENRTRSDHHFVQLHLVGTKSERDAIGAIVTLSVGDGRNVVNVVQTGDGYMSRNESLISVGLGEADAIDAVEIRWPGGEQQFVSGLGVNRRWLFVQGQAPYEMPIDVAERP